MDLNIELIRYQMAKRGITQTALAELTGLSRPTIGRLLSTARASYQTVEAIAEVLEIELGQMYVAPKEA